MSTKNAPRPDADGPPCTVSAPMNLYQATSEGFSSSSPSPNPSLCSILTAGSLLFFIFTRNSASSSSSLVSGGNCIKISLPEKLILSKRKRSLENHILWKIVSENLFSGKTYFYALASSRRYLALPSSVAVIVKVLLVVLESCHGAH